MLRVRTPRGTRLLLQDILEGYMITQHEYTGNPDTCPSCGKQGHIHREFHTFGMTKNAPPSLNTLLAKCRCCGAQWFEKWKLQGFEKVWKPPRGLFDHMDRGLNG